MQRRSVARTAGSGIEMDNMRILLEWFSPRAGDSSKCGFWADGGESEGSRAGHGPQLHQVIQFHPRVCGPSACVRTSVCVCVQAGLLAVSPDEPFQTLLQAAGDVVCLDAPSPAGSRCIASHAALHAAGPRATAPHRRQSQLCCSA